MPRPYTPLALSNHFLARFCGTDGIEHMKLQKLVYCAHGWWLATRDGDEQLVDERPEVWRFGPVFPSLYRALKPYGRMPITEPQSENPFADPAAVGEDDIATKRLLDWTWRRYGHLSSYALSDMTHKKGTPWYRVAEENNFSVPQHQPIPDKYVREEFRRIMDGEARVRDRQGQLAG